MARRHKYTCSFCGKSQDKVQHLFAGPHGVLICHECVMLCYEILTHDKHATPAQQGDEPRQTVRHRTTSWWRRLMPGRRQVASLPVRT